MNLSSLIARSRSSFLGPLALACFALGCGTASYDERFETTLVTLRETPRSRVSLDMLYSPMPAGRALAENRVNLRVPMAFRAAYVELSVDRYTRLPLHPHRLYPLGIELPGFQRMYEAGAVGPNDPQNLTWPYNLYIGALPAAPGGITTIKNYLEAGIRAELPEASIEWKPPKVTDADQQVHKWEKLRLEDKFFFQPRFPDGKYGEGKYDGVVEFYVLEEKGFHVILASKVLKQLEEQTLIAELMPLVASTVTITDSAEMIAAVDPTVQPTPGPDGAAPDESGTTNGGDPATGEAPPETEYEWPDTPEPAPPLAEATKKSIRFEPHLNEKMPPLVVEKWLSEKPPELAGKMVFIDYFASWCAPCRKHIPLLNKLHELYGDRLVVLALVYEPAEKFDEFTDPESELTINYYIGQDRQARMNKYWGVNALPHAMLVDPSGIIRWQGMPEDPAEPLTPEAVKKLLNTYLGGN